MVGSADKTGTAIGIAAAAAGVAESFAEPVARRTGAHASAIRADIRGTAVAPGGAGRSELPAGSRLTSTGATPLAHGTALAADGTERPRMRATHFFAVTDAIATGSVAAFRLAIGTAGGTAFGIAGGAAATGAAGLLIAGTSGSGCWGRAWGGVGQLRRLGGLWGLGRWRGLGRLRGGRRGARVAAAGSLGIMQRGANDRHPAQTEQALQQGAPRASSTECTGQGIEATIIHRGAAPCTRRSREPEGVRFGGFVSLADLVLFRK